jgi:hypothetical protein
VQAVQVEHYGADMTSFIPGSVAQRVVTVAERVLWL